MEKEKILSTITEKLGKTSFSQQTIETYVDLNPLAEGAEPDDAYWDKAVAFINKMQGQYNRDFAAQVSDFKKNYKPENKQEPPKQEPEPNKEVEALRKTVDDLVKRLDEKDSRQAQEQLASEVKAEMKKLGATDDYVLRQTLRGRTLDSSKTAGEIAKELIPSYDSELTECRGKGAAPRNGEQGTGGKGKTDADRFFASKQKKEGWGNETKK